MVTATIPSVSNSQEAAAEIVRCSKSARYFFDNYVYILDSQKMAAIKWSCWPCHVLLLDALDNHKQTIVVKARQLGVSWMVVTYLLWLAMFHYGARIAMFSKGEQEAAKLLDRVDFVYRHLPEWMQAEMGTSNTQEKTFVKRESGLFAFPATKDAGRSESATMVFDDEWAFHPFPEDQYSAISPIINAPGGRFIGATTGNGAGTFVHGVWQAAELGENNFHPLFFGWFEHPDRDQAWYERTKRDMPKRRFHQEYPSTAEEAFVQGGSPLFDDEYLTLRALKTEPIKFDNLPESLRLDTDLKIYQMPRPDRKYCLGADVADGEGDAKTSDRSCVTVIDWESNEEVAFWLGRKDVGEFAQLIHGLSLQYKGVVAVERNGIGIAVIKKLEELETNGLFREVQMLTKEGEVQRKGKHGWVTNKNNKPLMLTELEEALRLGYHRVASKEFLAEARVFQDLGGGQYGAPSGFRDDSVLSRAITLQMRKYMNQSAHEGPRVTRRGPALRLVTRGASYGAI